MQNRKTGSPPDATRTAPTTRPSPGSTRGTSSDWALPGSTTWVTRCAARKRRPSSSTVSCTPRVPGAMSTRWTPPPVMSCGATTRSPTISPADIRAATWSTAASPYGRARSMSPPPTDVCMRSTPRRAGKFGKPIPSPITSYPTPARARRRLRAMSWSSATAAPTWAIPPCAAMSRPTIWIPVRSNGASIRFHRPSGSRTRIRNWPKRIRLGTLTASRICTGAERPGMGLPMIQA